MADKQPPPPDQQYRDRIVSDLDCTMLVEAAAGTGKTTCLINRMVELLREGNCSIETLAAVTFTRKAAAELRTRFQLALEQAAKESPDQQRERLNLALRHVERCFIGTIHSFCARLLRERPVEAGVDPGFVELDEVADAQLRQQAWREHVASLITTNDPILPELEQLGLRVSSSTRRSNSIADELDELGLEPAELGPAFLAFAEYADVPDWPAHPAPLPDLAPCVAAVRGYADHIRSLHLPGDFGNDGVMPKYDLISRMVRRLDLAQPAQLMEVLEQFERRAKVVHKAWPGKKEQALAEQARWDEFRERYAVPLLVAWREHRYGAAMRAIRPAQDVYDSLRREQNGLSFQDLLLLSVRLLRDHPDVRRYFRQRFTHLLVDEFQDTDPLQAEVMLLVTADDCRQKNWQRCRPVAGSLFVVGDPKQSIYRFRRADIVTYNKVRSIIERVGGQVVPLSANFRSIQPLVQWVNGCFCNVFPSSADQYSPADRPLDVGRTDGAQDESPPVYRLASSATFRRNDDLAQHEADLIARTIRRAIDEKWPVPRTAAERDHGLPGHALARDFLVVARSKARLSLYARRLQHYGLPHSVTGGGVLNEVPELELLYTCLRAVARPDDPIALVAVLRSELFGVADTLLDQFRQLGGRFSYHADIPGSLPAHGAAILRDAWERLQSYARILRRIPAAAAIERIAGDLGLIARACAAEQGDAHAGSLLKAIELLRTADRRLTAADCVDALGRLVAGEEQYDGVPVRPPGELPVRVMNLHQCKGLEAPWVFLVDPAGETDHPIGVHIDRSAETPRGYLPIYGRKHNQWQPRPLLAHPPGWDNLAAKEQRFLDAEDDRLLYVAATRAGVKVVISQREGSRNSKNPWRKLDDHLQSAPSLTNPGEVHRRTDVELNLDPADWRRQVLAIEDRWRRIAKPTYGVQSIKESAIAAITPGPKPHGAEAAGAEWGQVLHTMLEAAMKQPTLDLESLALSTLAAEDLPATLVDEVIATVERVMASELWRRAQSAKTCLTEVPLATLEPAEKSPAALPTVLRGVIDLVFHEPAGWVIVDYKTERVGDNDIPAVVTYYRPQVEAYGTVWEQSVKQPVSERGLFFTHAGTHCSI